MPRTARKKSYTNLYHVIFRGINKQNIFFDAQDMWKFKKEIERTKVKFNYKIFAYVLMGNHVHLGIKDNSESMSKAMQSLAISYSSYFNKKYERTGHLFENRYLSTEVNTERYLLSLTRYIHQNPLKARIGNIKEYKWSSYKEYIYNNGLIDESVVLNLFSENKKEALRLFEKFNLEVEDGNELNEILEYELEKKIDDKDVAEIIKEILKINDIYEVQRVNKEIRDKMLMRLCNLRGISQRQLARILGIDNKVIQRVVKKTNRDVSQLGQSDPRRNVPNGSKGGHNG